MGPQRSQVFTHRDCPSYSPEGDHEIFVGRLLEVTVRDGEPLVYFRGGYASLNRPSR